MFLINTKPLRSTKTVADYAKLLFHRFIKEHYNCGVTEIHLIFDKENTCHFNPKVFEQTRRDSSNNNKVHEHVTFDQNTPLPLPWKNILECRKCKYSLIKGIGLSFFQLGRYWIGTQQSLILAGCFEDDIVWCIKCGDTTLPQPHPDFLSNAKEADQLIWRHAIKCNASNVLIYSPDTDIYNIGVSISSEHSKQITVQINVPHSSVKKYLNVNNLTNALLHDPDLALLTQECIPTIMTALFVATGCDFTSYFKGLGKATFLNTFFQHASFICGSSMPGSLSNFAESNRNLGFLSFLRLVGSVYFKKHLPSFISLNQHHTPNQLYNSIDPTESQESRHKTWISKIRTVVSERITSEDQRMPSITSLWRHWLRTTYVCALWKNSHLSDIYSTLPLPENCGWVINDGIYQIDWEDPEKEVELRQNIDYLLNGCKCKKGCKTTRCGCKRKGHTCGPGCMCNGCENSPAGLEPLRSESHEVRHTQNSYCSESDSSFIDSDSSITDNEEELFETEIITDFDHFLPNNDII